MKDLYNKEIRKELIAKYLDAETSPAEEKKLCSYYSCHEADEDEREFAKLIQMENDYVPILSDESELEYDRIIMQINSKSKRMSIRWMAWASGMAASIALFFLLKSAPASQLPNTVEIAQSIQQMMNLDGIKSITATPIDECVWVKAEFENGIVKTFIMSKDEDGEATSLLAIN